MAQKWIESVKRLKKQAQKSDHQRFEKAIETIINGGTLPISEGEKAATEGVGAPATPVTTSTNEPSKPARS